MLPCPRFLLLLYLSALLCISLSAQASEERIGLVLGGGGARGAAHVGVLKVLEQEGVAIDMIVGTSMGAIVGALYSAGYRAADIEAILNDIDWIRALTDRPDRAQLSAQRKADAAQIPSSLEVGIGRDGLRTPQGVLQGQNFGMLLRELLLSTTHVNHFDQLPIPFRAVATDLISGEAVVLDQGDLVDAVRASMSVPGVFQPMRLHDRLLVDGGIADNVPIRVAQEMGATRLIVVDVGAGLALEEDLTSPASVTMQVISILMDRDTHRSLELLTENDVLIRPDLGDIDSAAFNRSSEAVPLGEAAALARRAELQSLQASAQRLAQHEARPQPIWLADRRIDAVDIEGQFTRRAAKVSDLAQALVGERADPADIEALIALLYGEGHFERIGYTFEEDNDQLVLRITPIDKSWGPHFLRLGLRLSDDFDGGSSYQLDALARIASEARPGAEWRARFGLGELNAIDLSWLTPMGERTRTFAQPYVATRALDQPVFIDDLGQEIGRLRWSRRRLGTDLGFDSSHHTRLYVRAEVGQDQLKPRIGVFSENVRQRYTFVGAGLVHDSLDDASFPTRGWLASSRLEMYRPWLQGETRAEVMRLDISRAWSGQRYTFLGGVRAVSALNDAAALQAVDFLGGLGNLSGYGERELAGPQLFLARGFAMRRMGDTQQLFALPTYLGVSLEAGNVWQQRSDFDLNDLTVAGSFYVGVSTPLGPVFLGYGRASSGRNAIYLNFGSLIRYRH